MILIIPALTLRTMKNNLLDLYGELLQQHREVIKMYEHLRMNCVLWGADDVINVFNQNYPDDEDTIEPWVAQWIAEYAMYKHDAENGICWITLETYIDEWIAGTFDDQLDRIREEGRTGEYEPKSYPCSIVIDDKFTKPLGQ